MILIIQPCVIAWRAAAHPRLHLRRRKNRKKTKKPTRPRGDQRPITDQLVGARPHPLARRGTDTHLCPVHDPANSSPVRSEISDCLLPGRPVIKSDKRPGACQHHEIQAV